MAKSKKFAKMSIGSRIAEYRLKKALSMSDLASKLDISQAQISYYESGDQLPGIEILKKLSTVLEIPLMQLVYGDEITEIQKLVPDIEKLPKPVQSDIKNFIKRKILTARKEDVEKQFSKEFE